MEVFKVTLSSKKVVYLRKPLIADTEKSAEVAGKGASDNQVLMGIKLQKEMLKLLLVKINDKVPTLTEKQQLDSLFTVSEYAEIIKVINKISSPEESEQGNEPEISFEIFGDK